jgi:hypothetical protein
VKRNVTTLDDLGFLHDGLKWWAEMISASLIGAEHPLSDRRFGPRGLQKRFHGLSHRQTFCSPDAAQHRRSPSWSKKPSAFARVAAGKEPVVSIQLKQGRLVQTSDVIRFLTPSDAFPRRGAIRPRHSCGCPDFAFSAPRPIRLWRLFQRNFF